MQSSIAKWGNSLAVRLPAESLRRTGLREGSAVTVAVGKDGDIRLAPLHAFDKAAFVKRLSALHRTMPESKPVVAVMRADSRY